MATFNVKLKSGQVIPVNHPDDWSQDQIRSAIQKSFPDNMPEQEAETESFGQKAFRYGVRDPAIGIAQFGRGLANTPHKVADLFGYGDRVAELAPSDFNYAEALGQKGEGTMADKIIQFAPELAAAFALPGANIGRAGKALESIPKIGGFASKALSEAIPQAGLAFTQAEESPVEAAGKAGGMMVPFTALSQLAKSSVPGLKYAAPGLGTVLGGYFGGQAAHQLGGSLPIDTIGALLGGALGARGFTSKNAPTKKLLEDVDMNIAKPRLEAAERLDLNYLTPAEAGLSPHAAAAQGAASKTEGGGRLMLERGEGRLRSEEKSIDKLLDTIYKEEEHTPEVRKLYDEAYPQRIPQDVISGFNDNKIIERARKIVESKPAYQESLKDVPKDSIAYWDHVKQAMDDMVSTLERRGDDKEASLISKTRADLRSKMDEVAPVYEQARNLSERGFARKQIEKAFRKKEMTGINMYKAIENKDVYEKLLHSLRNVPEAQAKLQDMRLIFKDLIGVPSVRTAAQLEKTSMTKPRSDAQFFEGMLEKLLSGKKNQKAAIEFITSKNWDDKVKELNKISDKRKKASAALEMFGKGISQALANQ